MKINLVNNGVFPITRDVNGNDINESLDTGLHSPGTVQGEGKLLGTSCLFIRTSGCNLRCAWVGANGDGSPCDTPYSSHDAEHNMMEIDEVLKLVDNNIGEMKYIVVSGGEPTMQKRPLEALLKGLKDRNLHVTIETNGTLFDEGYLQYVDLISISPKLSS